MTKIERVKKLCKWLIYDGYAESDSDLATKLGYTKSSFSQIINEKVPLSDKFIDKLCATSKNINKVWVLNEIGTLLKDLHENISVVNESSMMVKEPSTDFTLKTDRSIKEQRIPLYDIEATAGVVELFDNKKGKNKPIDYISIPNLPKCDGAIYVTGDSMYPLLKSGDIIMYKQLENSIDNIFFGEMYLVSIDLDGDEFVTVKWIHKSDKGEEFIKIVSQNSHHGPKDIHLKNIKAIALIKGSIRINSMS
jgi:phage repressor protein C with HTH and peptisase S24 domain